MKLSIKDFFSKYEQIPGCLHIWSHLLKKSLMENFIFGSDDNDDIICLELLTHFSPMLYFIWKTGIFLLTGFCMKFSVRQKWVKYICLENISEHPPFC